MIDTVKIYAPISQDIFDKVSMLTDVVKQGVNKATDKIIYEIVNDHLKGSFDSSLSVRVCDGAKYGFGSNVIVLEGSPHKIFRGQNAYNGVYNLVDACTFLIGLVEYKYDIMLPDLQDWYLQRVDIAKCFDLGSRNNVVRYIDNFRFLHFPRRDFKPFGSCIYFAGSTTTLKIYDKYKDFFVNDKDRIFKYNKNSNNFFDTNKYLEKIIGFVRFEVEIKSRYIIKLCDEYKIDKHLINFNYDMLNKVFNLEFGKIFKVCDSDMKKVCKKNDVRDRLFECYKPRKANVLYNLYLSLIVDGFDTTKSLNTKSTFYRNLKELSYVGVDYTQTDLSIVQKNDFVYLDIFTAKEVA